MCKNKFHYFPIQPFKVGDNATIDRIYCLSCSDRFPSKDNKSTRESFKYKSQQTLQYYSLQKIYKHFQKMERLPTWVYLFGLSVVIIAAGVDQFPAGQRGGRENYFIATAIISLLFSFFFIVANLVDRLGNIVVGNKIENGA